jgi:hypothetical protein
MNGKWGTKMRAAKAWVAAIGTVVMALSAVLADDLISTNEIGTLAIVGVEAALTIIAVYQVPNAGFVEKPQ